ncbi:MAG: ATP-dependent DNA helicase RecG [Deltaproteobacteria bacterium]|nr:ATP-dependent DNA helicase RecG [Deltaproteobacteria bacterium]
MPVQTLPTLPEQLEAVERAAGAIGDGGASDDLLALLRGLAVLYRGPLRERLVKLGTRVAAGEARVASGDVASLVRDIREGSRPKRTRSEGRKVREKRAEEPAAPVDPLLAPVGSIRGVGPRLAERLAVQGVRTVEDLALWPPRDYRDRRHVLPLSALREGQYAVTSGFVVGTRIGGPFWRRRVVVRLAAQFPAPPAPPAGAQSEARSEHAEGRSESQGTPTPTGELSLVWFRAYPGQADKFPSGTPVRVAGTPMRYEGALQMVHPELIAIGDEDRDGASSEPIVPVYTKVAGFDQRRLRRVVGAAMAAVRDHLRDPVPAALRVERNLRPLAEAARLLHHPSELLGPHDECDGLRDHPAGPWRRLVYGEALTLGVAVARARAEEAARPAPALAVDDPTFAAVVQRLGFEPTGAQGRAFAALRADLRASRPMRRLLQGDVGAGKTAVAMIGAVLAATAGRQAAILAPTEILADQHAQRLSRLYGPHGIRVVRLSGGMRKRERHVVAHGLALGTPQIVVGTHALLEDPVVLPRLAFVVVDEQQRFGVHQRFLLARAKTETAGTTPHLLVMTATPIPRTLALALYGELDLTVLDELPPGRKPIRTETVEPGRRAEAYERLAARVEAGDQVFVVCPLVEPSEDVPLPSATGTHAELAARLGPGRVALLHGRLLPDEKLAAIGRFRDGSARVLVSTTVVEVGIDVPAASGVLIDGADRFGLSQLHQIRGRVGRAGQESWCLLLRATEGEAARQRCEVVASTNDGFRIAEADLELRGAGDLFGARQSGLSSFRFADPLRDAAWIAEASADARRLVAGSLPLDPDEARRLDDAVARFSRSWGRTYDEGAG